MKIIKSIAIWAVIAACVLWTMVSCTATTVRVVTTDKAGTVTETVTTTKATDPGALVLAGSVATAYAPPRTRIVREEKADHDMKRLLQSRPITHQEIAMRWRPSPH